VSILAPVCQSILRPVAQSISAVLGTSGFSPTSLFAASEQGAWYDPSDFASMFQDSAGTTPVTAVGQVVGRINDKSGRGNHALQATTAAKPIVRQDAGGKYYLELDGVDDTVASVTGDLSGSNKLTVWAGARLTAGTATIIANEAGGAASPGGFRVDHRTSVGTNIPLYGIVFASGVSFTESYQTTAPAVPKTGVYVVEFDTAQALAVDEIKLRANGAVSADTVIGGPIPTVNFANSAFTIGQTASSQYLNGRIYQLIVRGAASTAQQITDTETFVNSKTGAY